MTDIDNIGKRGDDTIMLGEEDIEAEGELAPPARGLIAKFDINAKMKRAGRARTRYLTEDGIILRGDELFAPSNAGKRVMAIAQSQVNMMRSMQPKQRKKLFRANKSWMPAAIGNSIEIVDKGELDVPALPALPEEVEGTDGND